MTTKAAEGAALSLAPQLGEQADTLIPSSKKQATHVCVIRKNWGQPGIVESDWMGGRSHGTSMQIEFKKGVARNVPRDLAEEWEAHPDIGVHILPNDADEGDFVRVTGVQLMPIEAFAAMVKGYDTRTLAEFLGPEDAQKLSDALARHGITRDKDKK